MNGLLGKKIGMTTFFNEKGQAVPCTVIEAGPCYVTQIKTRETDGYDAVQLGFDEKKERLVNKPMRGHFAKSSAKPLRILREFKSFDVATLKLGAALKVNDVFAKGDKVAVSSTSKGRGFQGVVKRHHFSGGSRTHGQSDRERAPGSIGSSSFPSRVYKGQRMAGRMGGERVTIRNLTVVQVMPESNLLLIKGSIPGAKNGYVEIVKK